MMYVLLPLVSWGAIVFVFVKRGMSLCAASLSAAIVWGVLLTFITELLGLFNALTKEWIALSWTVATLITIVFFFFSAKKETRLLLAPLSRSEKALSVGIVFLCLATFLTALFAPPNTWDSMTYHMSRVVHWLQNRSVAHYPTASLRQLELNPWAEFGIAHFQALSGGDRFANLVQWFSMIGSVIGATLVADRLGARQRGQLLAAVLAVSIPMGILQASSTQNDYVVAFWLLCFAWSGIRLKEEQHMGWAIMAGASLGLALLTKGTAYLYALPFAIWFFWAVARSAPGRAALFGLGVLFPCLFLNAGHYYRNYTLFSNPLASDTAGYSNETIDAKSVLSNVVRNSAIHLSTPFDEVNTSIEQGIGVLHDLLGVDINDERTTWPGTTFGVQRIIRHEDYSGNLLHAVLALITLGLLVGRRSVRSISSAINPYVLCVTGGFLLFCLFLKWQPWNSRLHLPLFVLGAPATGVVLGRLRHQGLALTTAGILIVAAVPWALWNISRPLAPPPKAVIDRFFYGNSLPATILTADRIPQYFTNRLSLWRPYLAATNLIKARGARNIGLKLREEDWEYPLWVLLKGEGGKGPRIENIDVHNRSGNIRLGDFRPDLVVITNPQGFPTVTLP